VALVLQKKKGVIMLQYFKEMWWNFLIQLEEGLDVIKRDPMGVIIIALLFFAIRYVLMNINICK